MSSGGWSKIGTWLMRLATWDGVMPAAVWSAPQVVEWLVPQRRGAIELTAIVVPVVACLVRFYVGRSYILSNGCRLGFRRLQVVGLWIGLIVLALSEAVLILSRLMPQGFPNHAPADQWVWLALGMTYVTAMAVALYPGREDSQ